MKIRFVLKWVFLMLGLAGALLMILSKPPGGAWWRAGAGVWIVSLAYLVADDLARRQRNRRRKGGRRS